MVSTASAVGTAGSAAPVDLLLLGRGVDRDSERGVECPGDLPAASDPDLVERARTAKAALGDQLFVLGHHYQRDEVIQFADVTGDSFKLARDAAAGPAPTTSSSAACTSWPRARTSSPDRISRWSCPTSRPAARWPTWPASARSRTRGTCSPTPGSPGAPVPVTYMNSTAAIKAFTGRHGGTVCTSSNAERALRWAFEQGDKVLFMPDQHLGRNTAVRQLGLTLDDCVVFDPHKPGGGLTVDQLRAAKMLLWRGHCSVHGRFTVDSVNDVRERIPDVRVIVHPECRYDVVSAADVVGSTEAIIRTIDAAPAGSAWAVGTELNLVKRLAAAHPDQRIVFLDKSVCYCSTMNRIDLPHLVHALENLVAGRVVGRIQVDDDVAHWARVALEQMLALPAA